MELSESSGNTTLSPQLLPHRPFPLISPRQASLRSSPRGIQMLSPIPTQLNLSPLHQINPLSPTTRQSTRALQEIQSQIGFLTPSGDRGGMNIAGNLISSMNTPTPSPDEMVIQARGRRQVPLTFSPDVSRSPHRHRFQGKLSPNFQHNLRLMLPTQTRSSPRKRLNLTDTPPSVHGISHIYTPSPDKHRVSPLAKKLRLDSTCVSGVPPETAIKAISKIQLEKVVEKVLLNHPELRQEVSLLIPAPDLTGLEEKLNFLKKNIYKSLPNTRLESKTDSLAYNRVSVHLQTFKKGVVDGAKTLLEGEQFVSLVDYCIMAWGYVKATPEWDNPPHNSIRKSCFKHLSTSIMKALKDGKFSKDELKAIQSKLHNLKGDSEELMVCVKFLDFCLAEDLC